MRIVRTQHPCWLEAGQRCADVQEPHPAAQLLFVEWPDDPGWPVQITWTIPTSPAPRAAPAARANPSGGRLWPVRGQYATPLRAPAHRL